MLANTREQTHCPVYYYIIPVQDPEMGFFKLFWVRSEYIPIYESNDRIPVPVYHMVYEWIPVIWDQPVRSYEFQNSTIVEICFFLRTGSGTHFRPLVFWHCAKDQAQEYTLKRSSTLLGRRPGWSERLLFLYLFHILFFPLVFIFLFTMQTKLIFIINK